MKLKKKVSLLMACIMAIGSGLIPGQIHAGQTRINAADLMPQNPVYHEETDTTDWNYVTFGEYPQTELTGEALTDEIKNAVYDSNGDAVVNGEKYRKVTPQRATYPTSIVTGAFYNWSQKDAAYFKYEPITWRVLQNEGDSLFLLADQVIDCRQYQRNDSAVTWETSLMRTWVNGYYPFDSEGYNFITEAFTEDEQNAIKTTKVTDSDNVLHGTKGGNDTQDKVYLLSIKEATNSAYGFPSDFMNYSSTRRMKPSDYAFAMGVWKSTYNEKYDGYCWWLLRSPGSYGQAVSMVYRWGNVYQDGYYAETKYYGVCPCIRVDINSKLWKLVDAESTNTKNTDIVENSVKSAITYGDVNKDNDVTLEDANIVLKAALLIQTLSTEEKSAADVNGDNDITLEDANLVLKRSLKIINKFPVEEQVTPPTEVVTETPVSNPTIEPSGQPTIEPTVEPTVKPTIEPTIAPTVKPTVVPTIAPTETPLVQTTHEPSGKVWIAADSIAASHGKSGTQPLYGWGELLGNYFNSSFQLNNTAISGSSTKSFTTQSNYSKIKSSMGAGDYLLISFGHNDERPALELYTDPYGDSNTMGTFKWYLKNYYIDPAIRKGVTPVLISPIVRRYFLNGQLCKPLHTQYATAMEELKEEYASKGINIYYIDLHHKMLSLYQELGEEGTLPLHGLSNDYSDTTHLSERGAEIACQYMIEEMKNQNMDICQFLNAN